MNEWLLIAAIALAAHSGVPGLFQPRGGRAGERAFVALLALAAACACAGGIGAFIQGPSGFRSHILLYILGTLLTLLTLWR